MMSWLLLLLAAFTASCSAQSTFSPLRPPSLPLAVKSPYLSTWQQAGSDNGNGGYLPGQWPTFWRGSVTGWTGYVRVDNITYIWMGDPATVNNITNYYAIQTAYEYTSTQSIFTLDVAGQIQMTVNFLSPVLPDTLLEMSLPYSYMDVTMQSLDGKRHVVQLYTDISAEWASGNRGSLAQWSYGTSNMKPRPNSVAPVLSPTPVAPGHATTFATAVEYTLLSNPTHGPPNIEAPGQGLHPSGVTSPPLNAVRFSTQQSIMNMKAGGVAYHKVWRQTQLEFTESTDQAEWGYWYYATDNVRNLTYQQGSDESVRGQFVNNGFLANTQDTQYRAINDRYPTFGYAIDVGAIGKDTQKHHTFQISLHQQNCVYFETAAGNTSIPCFWTNYNSDTDAVEYFYNRYNGILALSTAVDIQVRADSVAAGGDDYHSLTSLAVRQAFGALEYTNSPSRPWVFVKEISSDGDCQTVDVIFPFHPILIYFNANILQYILDPLFVNQEAGYWPFAFSIHHLGPFPNATGFNSVEIAQQQGEPQPIEECGDMILMALAYAQRTGDNAYLAEHYSLLRQWNEYLVNYTLIPGKQLSTDDFLGQVYNDTNLALKGIVGIEAMAQIANRTGHTADGVNYTNIAHEYIWKWRGYGIAADATPAHTTTTYGENTTFSLLYNLYPDAMLGLQLVPQKVYDMQSNFYPTVFKHYGVPLRNSVESTKVDWELWAAAIASNSTKNHFISIISTWLDQTATNLAFTDWYLADTGNFAGGFNNRPVVGAMFSLLALESAPSSGFVSPISS